MIGIDIVLLNRNKFDSSFSKYVLTEDELKEFENKKSDAQK